MSRRNGTNNFEGLEDKWLTLFLSHAAGKEHDLPGSVGIEV
jgi:hypothetical protein